MYLGFDCYKEYGGKLQEGQFTRAEFSARMKIDEMTSGRLDSVPVESPTWEKVRMLVLELVERGWLGDLGGRDLKSQSDEGTSESYESIEGKAEAMIRQYLGNEKTPDGVYLISRTGVIFGEVARA